MPYIDYKITSHMPGVCRVNPTINAILEGQRFSIMDNRYEYIQQDYVDIRIDDCYIKLAEFYTNKGITDNWFKTSLIGKDLYIPVMGGLSWLPLTTPHEWLIVEKGKSVKTSLDLFSATDDHYKWPLAKVNFQDEKNLAELCCNAYKYHFDFKIGQFVPHDDPEWNLVKGLTRKYSTILSGGDEERHADYGRLILFLLSKVELTDEEKEIISPLLQFAPTASQLESVISRETLIQKFVSEAKKSPTRFLLWGEDWAHFWWETNE